MKIASHSNSNFWLTCLSHRLGDQKRLFPSLLGRIASPLGQTEVYIWNSFLDVNFYYLESDNPRKSGKKSEKQKHAPPTINRRLEQRGFLTTSNIVERMGAASKIPKSRIKKISSCQQRKTVEMNEKEQEFLESSALDLETLLNDETVKW